MKQRLLLSLLTYGLLLGNVGLQAQSDTKTLVQHQINNNKKKFKQVPKEILSGLQNSFIAMKYLKNNKIKEAKKLLNSATINFEQALKEDPNLDIIPLEESVKVYESLIPIKDINHILTMVQEMLIHYDLEGARKALNPLRDEIDITTTSIPMKLFPLASKNALNALNKGDANKAILILEEGFNVLLVEKVRIPLSLLNAQDLIMEASQLDKSKKVKADKLLTAAKNELKKARFLGYTNSETLEYKSLTKTIDKLQKEINGINGVEKIYDEIKRKFESLINKSKNSNKALAKVNAYQQKEAMKAIQDTSKFQKEAIQEKSKILNQ